MVDGRVWDVMVRSGDVWWTQVLSGLVDGELVWGLVWYAPVMFCLDGVVRPMVESGEVGTGLVWKGLLF